MNARPVEHNQQRIAQLEAEVAALRAERDEYRQQADELRLIVDNLPVMVWLSDIGHKTIFVNRTELEFTGLTAERALGDGWISVIHPADHERVLGEVQSVLPQHARFDVEYRMRRYDGEYRWVIDRGRPVYDSEGHFSGYTGVSFDITERREVEQALQASEARFQAVARHMPVMLNAIGPDGTFTFWNEECERITGYAAAEIVGRRDSMTRLYPDPAYLASKLAELQQRGGDYRDMEWVLTDKEGSQHITLWSNISGRVPIPGWPTWAVGIDVTRWVALEHAAADSQSRYASLVENAPAIIYRFSFVPTPHFEYISASITTILGYEPLELYRDFEMLFRIVHREDRDLIQEMIQDVAQIRLPNRVRCFHRNGSLVWMEGVATPIFNADGVLIAIEGVSRDITALIEAEALRTELEAEKEQSVSKLRFLSMASHELRAPLASILSSSDLIRVYGDRMSEERKTEHLERIQDEVKYMKQLLEDFMMMGMIEGGRMEVRRQALNLERFLRVVVDELRETMKTGHTLLLNTQGACGVAEMDDHLLRQIVTNLVSNAVKYSPEDSLIEIDLRCDDPWATLVVRDQGIGIPEADQANLFTPFYRASNARRIEGTGLGLSITKAAVEIMGGSIIFESRVDEGTTFVVRLPLR